MHENPDFESHRDPKLILKSEVEVATAKEFFKLALQCACTVNISRRPKTMEKVYVSLCLLCDAVEEGDDGPPQEGPATPQHQSLGQR